MTGKNNLKPERFFRSSTSGFTLVELLVVVFLLSIVMVIISSVATQAFSVQRRSFAFQQVEENVRVIMETISKEIRVSEVDITADECSDIILLEHPVQGSIGYHLEDGLLVKTDSSSGSFTINSNTVEFTHLAFCTYGFSVGDGKQPRVTMRIGVKNKSGKDEIKIDLQTTVSLRKLID